MQNVSAHGVRDAHRRSSRSACCPFCVHAGIALSPFRSSRRLPRLDTVHDDGHVIAARVSRPRYRRLRAALLVCAVFLLGYPVLYAAVVPEDNPPPKSLPMPPDGFYRVFVVDWSYHTAIVVEQPRGWRLGPPGNEAAPFIEYAWGDRRFYMSSDYRPHTVFATLFLPTESVLYVEGRANPPRLGGAEAVFSRTVDAHTVHALLAELERFARSDASGVRAPPFAPVSSARGRFYTAYGKYLWSRDCNWWTVARLAAVGLADRPAGVVFTPQVPRRLREFTPLAAAPSRFSFSR